MHQNGVKLLQDAPDAVSSFSKGIVANCKVFFPSVQDTGRNIGDAFTLLRAAGG